jgi:hypothetical protein
MQKIVFDLKERICCFDECNIARHWNANVCVAEVFHSSAENFKMRLNYFHTYVTDFYVSENHSLLKSVMLPENCSSNWLNCNMTHFCVIISTRSFNYFLRFLLVSWFPKLAWNLWSVFCNTYACEQAFSHMKQNKSKFHSKIASVNLTWCRASWNFRNGTKRSFACLVKASYVSHQ